MYNLYTGLPPGINPSPVPCPHYSPICQSCGPGCICPEDHPLNPNQDTLLLKLGNRHDGSKPPKMILELKTPKIGDTRKCMTDASTQIKPQPEIEAAPEELKEKPEQSKKKKGKKKKSKKKGKKKGKGKKRGKSKGKGKAKKK